MHREREHVLIPGRPYDRRAFTITELLTVVAIIAILIAILLPSLGRARELAHITKCSANQRTLAQAVQFFAVEHQGYGQLIAVSDTWKRLGYRPGRYVYVKWPWPVASIDGGKADLVAAPWPIAYADYLGAPGLKTEELLDSSLNVVLTNQRTTGGRRGGAPVKVERVRKATLAVLQCPSDRDLIGRLAPPAEAYGRISYSINTDLFQQNDSLWRDGKPHNGLAIRGQLDRIVRPAEVLMFADGGGYPRRDVPGQLKVATLTFNSHFGPTWSDFARNYLGSPHVPTHRHSAAGGLVGAFADGHASYLSPVQRGRLISTATPPAGVTVSPLPDWLVATRFSPNPRITPYEP